MKKLFTILISLTLAFALVACGSDSKKGTEGQTQSQKDADKSSEETTTEAGDNEEAVVDLAGEIVITGSTSVASILGELINEFEAYNPDVSITYTGTGSSAGIEDAINGVNDLGVASRALKDEEISKGAGFEVFAWDGIAVIVHPSNEVSELSSEDILKIYSGEITNWSEVGGADAPINLMSREASSGTRGAFEELTGLEDVGMTDDHSEFSSNGSLQIAVEKDENAIGYVSFTYIDDTVKALNVDGGEPTTESVLSESYPLARPFNVVINEENYSDIAKAFVDFMLSEEGQEIVVNEGGIPIE
ncbi:MAG: phosphate ABC transporter substrate-binding protein [Clostridiales bacterium]|nr:phosphate ABC transporter substrate-binding protein [Clostridiales bacterium]